MKSVCYVSDDYEKFKHLLPLGVILCPDALKNEKQIIEWILDLEFQPKSFFTNSLFLVRELFIQRANVRYVNLVEEIRESDDQDDIGAIEILDRELRQSDRYMEICEAN